MDGRNDNLKPKRIYIASIAFEYFFGNSLFAKLYQEKLLNYANDASRIALSDLMGIIEKSHPQLIEHLAQKTQEYDEVMLVNASNQQDITNFTLLLPELAKVVQKKLQEKDKEKIHFNCFITDALKKYEQQLLNDAPNIGGLACSLVLDLPEEKRKSLLQALSCFSPNPEADIETASDLMVAQAQVLLAAYKISMDELKQQNAMVYYQASIEIKREGKQVSHAIKSSETIPLKTREAYIKKNVDRTQGGEDTFNYGSETQDQSSGAFSAQCGRSYQEDRYTMFEDLTSSKLTDTEWEMVLQTVVSRLQAESKKIIGGACYIGVVIPPLVKAKDKDEYAATLHVSNLGDSSVFVIKTDEHGVCNGEDKIKPLNRWHKPDDAQEKKFIEKNNGEVIDARLNGVLAVSRALGDVFLHKCGLNCMPEITHHPITLKANQSAFVVTASDGLTDALSGDQIAKIVFENRNKGAYAIAQALVIAALNCTPSGDNITVLVDEINPAKPINAVRIRAVADGHGGCAAACIVRDSHDVILQDQLQLILLDKLKAQAKKEPPALTRMAK